MPARHYQGQKVAILGFGEVGQAAYRYFKRRGAAQIVIHDQQVPPAVPEGVPVVSGPDYLKGLDDYDVVFRSPSIFPYLFETRAPIVTATNELFAQTTALSIGVTGTKGKGTVTSLIYEMLKAAGKQVFLTGNISTVELDIIDDIKPDDIIVIELSNTRLWDVAASPQIAVLLPIFPEHLDWHRGDFEEYKATKANITKFQGPSDTLIFNAENDVSRTIGEGSNAKQLPYPDAAGIDIRDGQFWIDGASIGATSDVQTPGRHNHENVAAALLAAWQVVPDAEMLMSAVRNFRGLPHRLQTVGTKNGVRYVDDSIGTTPQATMAAINAFPEPKVLILGGSDKGVDYQELGEFVASQPVKAVILIGETAPKLEAVLRQAHYSGKTITGLSNMEAVVSSAAAEAQAGDVVLLSPACASFGLFRNYADRGDQFAAAVNSL